MLRGREGEFFDALVIGKGRDRIAVQLAGLPIVVRLNQNGGNLEEPKFGERLRLRLDGVDLERRAVQFSRASRLQSPPLPSAQGVL